MNPRSEFKALKDWKDIELNSLTLTLTPALSLGEREKLFPRIGNRFALDLTRFRGSMREFFRGNLTPAPMNPRSEFKVLKDWQDLELNSLTLTLTPALSLGERENSLPRIGNMLALDLTRFRGSMREMVRGILSHSTVSICKLKFLIFEEVVHENDELAHTCGQGDQGFFTRGPQAERTPRDFTS